MPWGALIIGAFFVGGATLLLQNFVTGTSSADSAIKLFVPISLAAVLAMVVVFGLFGQHK